MAQSKERYFLTEGDGEEQEVTKEEFVRAERNAGFHNPLNRQSNEPATAGFSSSRTDTKGRVTYS